MKGFRGTLILAVVVGGLIAFVFYDEKQSEKQSAREAEEKKIFQLKPEDVVEIRVTKPDESMVIDWTDSKWKMTSPWLDGVETETAMSYLNSLANENGKELPKPASGQYNWADYNLDKPGASFELKKKDGSVLKFDVSRLAAFDGSYFVRLADKLILGSKMWGSIIGKSSSQMRDKRLIRTAGEVDTLTIETLGKGPKDKVVLHQKPEGNWEMEGANFALNKETINEYVKHLKSMRAMDYLADKANSPAMKLYGLDRPSVKIRLKFVKGETKIDDWTMTVAAEQQGVAWALSSSVPEIAKVLSYDAEQLRRGKSYFRDGHEPFKLDISQVSEIRIKDKAGERKFAKAGTDWKLQDAKAEEEIVTANLEQMLAQINQLNAKEFYPSTQNPGPIDVKLSFLNSDGKNLLELGAGADLNPVKGSGESAPLRYVKSNLTKDVLAVLESDWTNLQIDGLVRNKSSSKQ